jgi:hypothetical protein
LIDCDASHQATGCEFASRCTTVGLPGFTVNFETHDGIVDEVADALHLQWLEEFRLQLEVPVTKAAAPTTVATKTQRHDPSLTAMRIPCEVVAARGQAHRHDVEIVRPIVIAFSRTVLLLQLCGDVPDQRRKARVKALSSE